MRKSRGHRDQMVINHAEQNPLANPAITPQVRSRSSWSQKKSATPPSAMAMSTQSRHRVRSPNNHGPISAMWMGAV
jgi:hypothetical protein